MPGKTKKPHKSEEKQKPERSYLLAPHNRVDGISWHWQNKEGKLVPIAVIPDHGILNILRALEEAEDRVPFQWIQVIRLHAEKRGILNKDHEREAV
jgi:hypothetical protein